MEPTQGNPSDYTSYLLQTSNTSLNNSLIISSENHQRMYLHVMNGEVTNPIPLNLPFPELLKKMTLMGSVNGILCLSSEFENFSFGVILWNPVINQWKILDISRLPSHVSKEYELVCSAGLGVDQAKMDFKVVSLCFDSNNSFVADAYSSTTESWKVIDSPINFTFYPTQITLVKAIVNGEPLWIVEGNVDPDDDVNCSCVRAVFMLKFDVRNEKFKKLPLPPGKFNMNEDVEGIVGFMDSLAWVVFSSYSEIVELWIYDGNSSWKKGNTVHIGVHVMRPLVSLQCPKSGNILSEGDGKLFLFEVESLSMKEIHIEGANYKAFPYTGSLISLPGMKPVKMDKEEEDQLNALLRT